MKEVLELIPNPRTRFLRVKCAGCGNEQNIFSAPASAVKCVVCNQVLGNSGPGKIRILQGKAKVVKEFL
ncbi:MAG: 30S ribosomal protein S27e [Candidatus Diapherotrites archaeon]|nr:30S ribosomal protein S27e [Candidatus Diapherotrites archaeon]